MGYEVAHQNSFFYFIFYFKGLETMLVDEFSPNSYTRVYSSADTLYDLAGLPRKIFLTLTLTLCSI